MTAEFTKGNPDAPPGFFDCEAAGLAWLAAAPGGVPCAEVTRVDEAGLTLRRLYPAPPTAGAAVEFGRRLARTHDAGAAGFGAGPDGWTKAGFFGPVHRPLPMSLNVHDAWGRFYAEERLAPMLGLAEAALDPGLRAALEAVIGRCRDGDFDDDDPPARLHGDLWSGNVMWTSGGAVLIDPAAHGGHRETDLGMLALFGFPHLDAVHRGYESVHRLRPDWQARSALHQLYPLLAHVVLFGSGYIPSTATAAGQALGLP